MTEKPKTLKDDVRILDKESMYRGFYQLERYHLQFRRFDGSWSEPVHRELVVRHRVAAVLPYDPERDEVVLIEQFRIGALENQPGPWLIELVAGILDREESVVELAHRETEEETGLSLDDLIPIHDYWANPGGVADRIALFCGCVNAEHAGGIHGRREENEDIRVHVFDAKAAFEAARSGRINNAATLIALQWLELNHDYVRKLWRKK